MLQAIGCNSRHKLDNVGVADGEDGKLHGELAWRYLLLVITDNLHELFA